MGCERYSDPTERVQRKISTFSRLGGFNVRQLEYQGALGSERAPWSPLELAVTTDPRGTKLKGKEQSTCQEGWPPQENLAREKGN
ncbi:hypothetical protein VTN00DRAFT_4528 [Thermoascus crustaceus]|uniref:uncharacterized protein n=1 Tax=Thermoascus crustaceus TaxID=5088 RepID=UPI0037446D57